MVKRCLEQQDNIITHPIQSVTGASMNAAMEEAERWIREHKCDQVALDDVPADQMEYFSEMTSGKQEDLLSYKRSLR
jgi:hypothetical protein